MTVIGMVTSTSNGFTNRFKMAITTATMRASKNPCTLIPGIKKAEMATAIADMRMFTRKFMNGTD